MEEHLNQRAKRNLLRVTLPNGKVICHKSVTMTFIETLVEIGSDNFEKITTESCRLPLLSKEIYPRFKDYMKPVCDGWYVNIQSDTRQKYMQLISIKQQLNLDLEVEMGTDFITSDVKIVHKTKKRDNKLLVKFPDGEYIGGENPIDTYLEAIWKIGIDVLKRKEIEYMGKPLITFAKMYNRQIQVGENRWLIVPPTTKDKYKMLRVISSTLRLNLEISII